MLFSKEENKVVYYATKEIEAKIFIRYKY